MLKDYLKEIEKISIDLIQTKKVGSIILNSSIFGENIPNNLKIYKISFIKKLLKKNNKLLKIIEKINKDNNLLKNEINILEKEIFIKIKKIEFLKKVYDTEANKLDNNYKLKEKIENYDYYNKIFYGVTKRDINGDYKIKINKEIDILISKEKLLELLIFSKSLNKNIKYDFGNYTNLSHNNGVLKIPNKKEYNIKTIIILFFHELTHLFRFLNGKNNLGFNYSFSDCNLLEEGIALYNEYKYGNKIINYGKHIPYNDFCYNLLLKDISLENKRKGIYNILKNKGFDKKKSLNYFYRFYRYTKIGGKDLFLKDLLYTKGYKIVKNLINSDKNNYKKIMSGRIGLNELNSKIISTNENIDTNYVFNKLKNKIISYI